jgi:hypothetical protein
MDHLHLVYEDEILKLYWDTQAQYHIAEWLGAVKGDKLKNGSYACLNASKTRPSKGWLADTTRMNTLAPDDYASIVEDFYPRLARSGVRYVAFVVPEKTLVHIPVRRMNKAYGDKGQIEFEYHGTRQAAADWLASKIQE